MDLASLFAADILSDVVALAAVIVSGIAIRQAHKTQMASSYFSEKANAYSEFLAYAAHFAFSHGIEGKSEFAKAYYQVQLFAPLDICAAADEVYLAVTKHNRTQSSRWLDVDQKITTLGNQMRRDLAAYSGLSRKRQNR